MRPPIFVRSLSDTEKEQLETALRSKDAFVMRRGKVILASERGERAPQIARSLGCGSQDGARCHPRLQRAWPCRSGGQILAAEANTGRLRRGGRRSPAGVAPPLSEGVRPPEELVDALDGGGGCLRGGAHREAGLGGDHPGDSFAGARDTLWQRAKRWITSPDPLYERKKASFASDRLMEVADGNPEWAIGFEDECWWSRVALPALSSFSEGGKPHRMIQQSVAKDDPDPKAISCYGLYLPQIGGEMWLRFVDGRPVSGVTT